MKHLKLFEKFSKSEYKKKKEEEEKNLIQELGNEYIVDIVVDGDFNGLKYLSNTGYDLLEYGDNNLITIALMSGQMKMFDYLIKFEKIHGRKDIINSVTLHDLLKGDYFTNADMKLKITDKMIEWLKIISNNGYDFNDGHNLIELYLSFDSYDGVDDEGRGKYKKVLKDGVEPFIDWLLEKYPENYKLVRNFISTDLKKKYNHLEQSQKYNL